MFCLVSVGQAHRQRDRDRQTNRKCSMDKGSSEDMHIHMLGPVVQHKTPDATQNQTIIHYAYAACVRRKLNVDGNMKAQVEQIKWRPCWLAACRAKACFGAGCKKD